MTNPNKKPRRKQLILSAATRGTASTNWRDPDDTGREFSRSLQPWIDFAQLAERGKLNNIFFIDHLSWFDVYGGNYKAAAKHAVNASRIDPSAPITAIALNTENIGIISTFSTAVEHPYHFARRLASLDSLSRGRVGWNIVSSYLPSMGPSVLNGEPLPAHDDRYDRAREYADAVSSLLLSSWRDDALVYDKINGVYADPDLIREINHKGKHFDIVGPAITEPTPQRVPLIAQAGTSSKGIDFGAEFAELIYVTGFDREATRNSIAEVRKIAKERYGRDPYSIKFIVAATPILGRTKEEAQKKLERLEKYTDPIDGLIYFGGASGINVEPFDFDEPVKTDGKTNGVESTTKDVLKNGVAKTPRQISDSWKRNKVDYVGTPSEVADKIQALVDDTDVDGINFNIWDYPNSLKDIVELLIPELQKRGLAQKEYPVKGGTLRENFYGVKHQNFVPETHPLYPLRWSKNQNKDDFESQLGDYIKVRDERRNEYYTNN